MPQEVGPMLYHTSIIFNSLDKSRDEGDYECNVDVAIERENSQSIIMNSASKTITVPSECYLNKLYTISSNIKKNCFIPFCNLLKSLYMTNKPKQNYLTLEDK